MNSRQKGARGEREGAAAWSAVMGGQARRGQQFSGGPGSPDIVCSHNGIHLECKRVEAGNPYKWMEQAVRDAGQKVPVVLHKRNRQEWLLIMRLADAPRFLLAAQDTEPTEAVGGEAIPSDVPGQGLPAAGEEVRVSGVCAVRRRQTACGDCDISGEGHHHAGQHVLRGVGASKNCSPGGQR